MSLLQPHQFYDNADVPDVFGDLPPSDPPLPSLLDGFESLYRFSSPLTSPPSSPSAQAPRPSAAASLEAVHEDEHRPSLYSTDHVFDTSPCRTAKDARRKAWKRRKRDDQLARKGKLNDDFGQRELTHRASFLSPAAVPRCPKTNGAAPRVGGLMEKVKGILYGRHSHVRSDCETGCDRDEGDGGGRGGSCR